MTTSHQHFFPAPGTAAGASTGQPVIAIHGGAGTIGRDSMAADTARTFHAALQDILRTSLAALEQGASAVDAVTLAVQLLEDCPLFNAGYGSVFTSAHTHELDAAIMDGHRLRAGAVAGVSRIRNPILAAQAVMQQGRHVLMVGSGAEALALTAGLDMVAPDYFATEHRRTQLLAAQASQAGMVLDHDGTTALAPSQARPAPLDETRKMGTVGAVALDAQGHLAAATSTGGMTNKQPGRVGDSPLIGSGTYADDRTAAVSCTGHGEAFIRASAAHDLCARMAYGARSLAQAAHEVIHQALPAIGGSGGLIALDAAGNVCLTFNTEGMYRGFARAGQAPHSFIYR